MGVLNITNHARAFAIWAHGDQMYGDKPYVSHLDDVVAILREFGYTDDDTIAAGFLHDVLEDSQIARYDDLGAFSQTVRSIMAFCTDAEGPNRKIRKAITYARCHDQIESWKMHGGDPDNFPDPKAWIPSAVRVKLADRIANVRNCFAFKPELVGMYRKERFTFRDALYVPMMCDAMWNEYNRLMAGS